MSILLIVFICLLFSAFFSGIEIAFISADKLRIELAGQQGSLSGRILSYFTQHTTRFIGTTLVGNNLALVLYSFFIATFLEPWLVNHLPEFLNNDVVVLLAQTVIATFIVLIVAEFTPKSIFLIDPNGLLSLLIIPFTIIYVLLFIPVWVIDKVSQFIIIRLLGFEYRNDKPVFGLTDLNNYVKNTLSESLQEEVNIENGPKINAKIFTNALEFKTVKVRECLIPRT